MKKIFIACILMASVAAHAHTADEVLAQIEKNNTTLSALRLAADAEKLENCTDIFLADPEVGFNYLWGNPSAIGVRKDYSISQTFDIATLSGSKQQLADRKNDAVEWQYLADRLDIMVEAKRLLVALTYYNSLIAVKQQRVNDAAKQLDMQKRSMDAGDGNKLDYNNLRLNLTTLKASLLETEAERDAAMADLQRLNGNQPVSFTDTEYAESHLPLSFAEWYNVAEKKNPVLAYVHTKIDVAQQQLAVQRREGLPTLSVGYMGEKTTGELYHGVALSVSVPLWSNKNKVRQARAAISAAEKQEIDAKQQFYGQLQVVYQRTVGLRKTADALKQALADAAANTQLLRKALDAGEISVVEYIMQISQYYEAVDKSLAAEYEYQKALTELYMTEL